LKKKARYVVGFYTKETKKGEKKVVPITASKPNRVVKVVKKYKSKSDAVKPKLSDEEFNKIKEEFEEELKKAGVKDVKFYSNILYKKLNLFQGYTENRGKMLKEVERIIKETHAYPTPEELLEAWKAKETRPTPENLEKFKKLLHYFAKYASRKEVAEYQELKAKAGREMEEEKEKAKFKPISYSKPSQEVMEKWEKEVGSKEEPYYPYAEWMKLDSSHSMAIITDPEGMKKQPGFLPEFLARLNAEMPDEEYKYISLKALREALREQGDVKIVNNVYDADLLIRALKVLGNRNIKFYVAGKEKPLAIVNEKGEVILLAPKLYEEKRWEAVPRLKEINKTEEQEKEERRKRLQLLKRRRETLNKYVAQYLKKGGAKYMLGSWKFEDEDLGAKEIAKWLHRNWKRHGIEALEAIAKKLYGRETDYDRKTNTMIVSYRHPPPREFLEVFGEELDRGHRRIPWTEYQKLLKREERERFFSDLRRTYIPQWDRKKEEELIARGRRLGIPEKTLKKAISKVKKYTLPYGAASLIKTPEGWVFSYDEKAFKTKYGVHAEEEAEKLRKALVDIARDAKRKGIDVVEVSKAYDQTIYVNEVLDEQKEAALARRKWPKTLAGRRYIPRTMGKRYLEMNWRSRLLDGKQPVKV